MEFTATGAAGLEPLIAEEVREFGGEEPTLDPGVVRWRGPLASGYRACLWSRFASRVLLQIGAFSAGDENELYENVRQIPWEDHFGPDDTFAVNCTLAPDAPYRHSKFAALRVKDAIVDRFRELRGRRPDVRVERPRVQVHLHGGGGGAALFIDLSGESLHRRGYRLDGGLAPLKETLAAAVVRLSGWNGVEPLVDPMCGSGTVLIEAALICGDSAPGLGRTYYGLSGWAGHQPALWDRLVAEALDREAQGRRRSWPEMIGFDGDPLAIRGARRNLAQAGVADRIRLEQRAFFLSAPPGDSPGVVLVNPPYGERLADQEVIRYLYRGLGIGLRVRFGGWRVGLFTASPDLTDLVGLVWSAKYRLFNGSIPCRFSLGAVPDEPPEEPFIWKPIPAERLPGTTDFGNRLRKNLKKRLPWAAAQGVECFRIYDRDLPEFNVCVDLYHKWVLVQEYAAPATVPEPVAAERLRAVLHEVRTILGAGRDRVFVKKRLRQRGKSQYRKSGSGAGKLHEVREGEARFLVNLRDYLDTGLFLDHRLIRRRIHQAAAGRRFLNLFGYTGTATIQAILGGADSSTTVDLSATYLRRAAQNFALNGIFPGRHELVQGDCLEWLGRNHGRYDLILVDPPTFSNTGKKHRVFEIQKGHRALIEGAMNRLNRGGLLLFSCNYRGFRLDPELLGQFDAVERTAATIPPDFRSRPPIHRCWEFRHRDGHD